MARKTGARGLRSIVEGALLDTMYDLPSMDSVDKVVIDESVIAGQSKPLLIYGKPEARCIWRIISQLNQSVISKMGISSPFLSCILAVECKRFIPIYSLTRFYETLDACVS